MPRNGRGPQFNHPRMSPRGEIYLNPAASLHLSSSTLLLHLSQQDYLQISTSKKHSYSYGTYQPKIRISHPAKQFEPSRILDSICCHNIILTILYSKRNIAFKRHSRPFPGVHLQSMERWVVTYLTPFGANRISVLWSEGKHPLQISGST